MQRESDGNGGKTRVNGWWSVDVSPLRNYSCYSFYKPAYLWLFTALRSGFLDQTGILTIVFSFGQKPSWKLTVASNTVTAAPTVTPQGNLSVDLKGNLSLHYLVSKAAAGWIQTLNFPLLPRFTTLGDHNSDRQQKEAAALWNLLPTWWASPGPRPSQMCPVQLSVAPGQIAPGCRGGCDAS